jgi:hypothetical protein
MECVALSLRPGLLGGQAFARPSKKSAPVVCAFSKMTGETAHPSFTDRIHIAFLYLSGGYGGANFSPSHETNEQVMHYQSSEPMVDRSNSCHWRLP